MAYVNITYIYEELGESDHWVDRRELCFVCATRAAVKHTKQKFRIYVESTDMELTQCQHCGQYISDSLNT